MAFLHSRIFKLIIFLVVLGCLLVGRLFYLQIVNSSKLAVEGLNGRVQEVPVEVARGIIVDRNGIPLTNTTQRFRIVVFPSQFIDKTIAIEKLAALTGYSRESLINRIAKDARPFKLESDINMDLAYRINAAKIPGVLAVAERMRYGYGSLASHITGYINTADNRGVSGIELIYDERLRGNEPEYAAALVDATQRIIPGLGYKRLRLDTGEGPHNVVLTIDARIQKTVEQVMDSQVDKGAIIVMRPSTGEVLAMASRPNFNANYILDYLAKDSAPLLNRAVVAYQPGSVFKLVVAAAALENEIVRPNDKFFDPGYIDVNHLRFKGWDFERGGRGEITFEQAMAYSSNPVFIDVGLKLGAQKLVGFAQKLGFGYHTKLDFDGEDDGNLPDPDRIYPGEIANLAIGQGSFEATPLQIVSLVATIANDGIKVDPYIVSRFTLQDGRIITTYNASRGTRVLSRKTALELRHMMAAVTKYGTGQAAYVDTVGSAGKTGSAETGQIDKNGHGVNHAWFAGYAPVDNPQYAVVVFVEEGMSGGDIAAPIFREVVEGIIAKSK
ncbi:Stage V sporulation protein D [bioreactor metagenome]|uniref:Stage V sporulation protein D n=1 Tax=bioreactor metagenome TaxID=1076179 RepID=A0A644V098_9ZZZZ|nr:penicillin-binding protein 2 [Negativicutes bacterium]